MADEEATTLEAHLDSDEAMEGIAEAVTGRRAIAHKYVMWVRQRNPEATPEELIGILERHYKTAISAAGAAITAGSIAADLAISLIPGGSAATAGAKGVGKQVAKNSVKKAAKTATKSAMKSAAKGVALEATRTGAGRLAAMLPAGDEQLQFEVTALFGLAVAEIHGMNLDKEQSRALVFGLTNGTVNQRTITKMASGVAEVTGTSTVGTGLSIAAGREDWSHWANTLADALPGGSAADFVRTIQTGQLETVRQTLTGPQQTTVEFGVGAVTAGIARFTFGQTVVESARTAFAEAPSEFPASLQLTVGTSEDDDDGESNRALAVMQDAARNTGTWVASTAHYLKDGVSAGVISAGTGVGDAASRAARSLQRIDVDGDGVPDDPRALTVAKNLRHSAAGVASTVGGRASRLISRKSKGSNGDIPAQ